MRVAHHDDRLAIRRRMHLIRSLEPHDLGVAEHVAEPVLSGPGGDVRFRPELDHERQARQRDRSLGAKRATGGIEPDLTIFALVLRARRPRSGANALARLAKAFLREPALANSRGNGPDDRVDVVAADVGAETERVRAGRERDDGGVLDAERPANRLHFERVGDHEPVEAEPFSKQTGKDARADRGPTGNLRHRSAEGSSAGTEMWAVMIALTPASIAARNGTRSSAASSS